MPTELFTIGYEQRTQDQLISELQKAGVMRLVDVRELPLSRKRGFSKSPLSNALAQAQIEYQNIRELGTLKPIRELYKKGNVDHGSHLYREYLRRNSRSAVIELSRTVDSAPTCLMCFERKSSACHRDVLVKELEALVEGLRVTHL